MLFQTKFTFRLWSFSFCAIFICARLSICDDYVQDQISDIGEGVDQNFAFHPSMGRVRQRQTLRRIVQSYYRPRTAFPRNKLHPTSDIENEFDIDNSVQPVNTGFTRKPSLAQIAYLLRNSQNPYPSALTRAKVIMKSGDANGVSGVINLKQMV